LDSCLGKPFLSYLVETLSSPFRPIMTLASSFPQLYNTCLKKEGILTSKKTHFRLILFVLGTDSDSDETYPDSDLFPIFLMRPSHSGTLTIEVTYSPTSGDPTKEDSPVISFVMNTYPDWETYERKLVF